MTVCTYYLRGACKYGDRCRNEHPADRAQQGGFGNQSWSNNTGSRDMAVPYTTESMARDVTPLQDKPLWPLSSYGAAKYEPVVIGGLDESPEELRVKAVTALKAGTINEYMKYESDKIAASEQAYNSARSNVAQLHDVAFKLSKEVASPGSTALDHVSPFGGRSAFGSNASAGSAFGSGPAFSSGTQPSMSGAASTTFGKSAFGQPAFGQSGFGTPTATSAFGQPAQTTSAFGQPQQSTSAFGQPQQSTSAFGQPAPTTSAFGQQPSSALGQTSAFGSVTQPTSAFGQSSLIKPGSGAFGSSAPSTGAFGAPSPAFGSTSTVGGPSPAFGSAGTGSGSGFSAFASQPSGFASAPTQASAFGQSSFGAPAPGSTPSAFAAPAQMQSAFSSAAPVQSTFSSVPASQSAFGSTPSAPSAIGGSSITPQSAFGSASTLTSAFGSTSTGAPSPFGGSVPMVAAAFATPMTTTLPDASKPSASTPLFSRSKIQTKPDRYAALLPPNYMDLLPVDVKAAFAAEKFEWGKIPEWIPPKEVR